MAHAKQKMLADENTPAGLIEQLGIKDAMHSLEADQSETFFKHHLRQAGYDVQVIHKNWSDVDFEQVQETRKRIKDVENEQVKAMASEILCPEKLLTEREIRNLDWSQLQPAPIIQLAHEKANALLCATGWDGNVERFVDDGNTIAADPNQAFKDAGVTDKMWTAARAALQTELSPDKIEGWSKGYLTVHYPADAYDAFQADTEDEVHHRSDALFTGALVKALLEQLPRTPAPMGTVGQALINAAQTLFGNNRLSALIKDGSVSPKIAKQLRFVALGKDATPTEAHFAFVKRFISEYYPARIAKAGDLYQLAAPQNTEQVDAFEKVMQCRVKCNSPDIDPEPQNGDLIPPPVSDPKAGDKVLVISMRSQGHSYRDIEKATGVPIGTAHFWCSYDSEGCIRSANFLEDTNIRKLLNAAALPESPQTHTTTAFESDSANVTSDKMNVTLDVTSESNMTSNVTFRAAILKLLTTGEKRTAEIVNTIAGNRVAIMNELKRLVDAGEIVKVKRGVYDLPIRSIPLPPLEPEKGAKVAYSPCGKIELPSTLPPEIRDHLAAAIKEWTDSVNAIKSFQVELENHVRFKCLFKALFDPWKWLKHAKHLTKHGESLISHRDHSLKTIYHILGQYQAQIKQLKKDSQ